MPRTNTVVDFSSGKQEVTLVAMSASDEARIDAEEFQYLAEKPMREWKEKIAGTDAGMPRSLEDLITTNSLTMTPEMKVRYDAKIKIRGERP
jgi:hypothetical protein